MLVFAVLWYFMHELSPMKPFMAIERHMTVMGGLFAVLAVNLVERLCQPGAGRMAGGARDLRHRRHGCAGGRLHARHRPFRAARYPRDGRAGRAALDGRDAVDWYATFPAYGHYPPLSKIDGATDYVVLVQGTAKRFAQSSSFARQSDRARGYARAYGELLARPAILVKSTAGSFSYRNVPLQIVALRSDAERLGAVLAKLGPLPDARLTLLPGRAFAATTTFPAD